MEFTPNADELLILVNMAREPVSEVSEDEAAALVAKWKENMEAARAAT